MTKYFSESVKKSVNQISKTVTNETSTMKYLLVQTIRETTYLNDELTHTTYSTTVHIFNDRTSLEKHICKQTNLFLEIEVIISN